MNDTFEDFIVSEPEGKKFLTAVQSGQTDVLPAPEKKLADKLMEPFGFGCLHLKECGKFKFLHPRFLKRTDSVEVSEFLSAICEGSKSSLKNPG